MVKLFGSYAAFEPDGNLRARLDPKPLVARMGEVRHANAKIIVLEGIKLSLMVLLDLDPVEAIW